MTTQGLPTHSPVLTVREITEAQHGDFLADHPHASFLQNPRWSQVKAEWQGKILGAFDGDRLVAAAVVLCRSLPVISRKFLAYMPAGPVFDPAVVTVESLLPRLVDYLGSSGAFLVRMGMPEILRRWAAEDVRRGLMKGDEDFISQLPPEFEDDRAVGLQTRLQDLGWLPPGQSEEFDAGQPRFQARIQLADSTVDQVLAKMDQTSRRQTRKSTRSELTITVGDQSDLPTWHALYTETARRDGFTPRPLEYFQRLFTELNAAPDTECTLYFAAYQSQTLAAAIYVRQGRSSWYVYGASSTEEPKRYAPRALQLHQIEQALAADCHWYDLGGVSPSLDSDHHLAGLTRFKTTMGADVVETLGEWDYPVNPLLAKAFNLYMSWR